MGIQENILNYLSTYGKENKYRLATSLKTDVIEVTRALNNLEKEGKIELKCGKAILVKGKKTIRTKTRKLKKQPIIKEELIKEVSKEETQEEEKPEKKEFEKEQPQTEVSEEPTEELQETFGIKTEEEFTKERIEGTVKFFNPDKGFGFIIGDNGKEYYVHKSGLKEGVTIEANDRVSFKVVQGDKGPKAEEVEWVSQA